MTSTGVRPRVVVVGGGFGGLSAVAALKRENVDVTLVDRNNYHGFWPLLYQVATSHLEAEAIAFPIRSILRRQKNAVFRMADVQGIDFDAKQVLTERESFPYDYLILACGSETNFFGNTELEAHAYGLKTVEEADRLRNHILYAFEKAEREPDPKKRDALLTFVLVGGGATGVEMSGALAVLIQRAMKKDFPDLDLSHARIILCEGGDALLAPFVPRLRDEVKKRLEELGVEVRLSQVVDSVEDGIVTFKDGSQVGATTVVWSAGVKAATLADRLGLQQARQGRIPVQPTLNLADRPEVYVIGDMMYLEGFKGGAYPMVAQVAIQGGKQAAKNIVAAIEGKPQKPFKYFDKGMMAIIGRRKAVMDAFGIRMKGFFAWIAWLFLHILYLAGFRNRALVLVDWFGEMVSHNPGVRIITRVDAADRVDRVQENVLQAHEEQRAATGTPTGVGTGAG